MFKRIYLRIINHNRSATRKLSAIVAVLTLAIVVAGCSDGKPIGKPETVGSFRFQRYKVAPPYEYGASPYEYFNISYGDKLRRAVYFPIEKYKWDRIDEITRLPSSQLAWLLRVEDKIALMAEESRHVVVKPLWNIGEDSRQWVLMERIDDHRWYIPDLRREGTYPNFVDRGGRLFDGKTFAQHWLPARPKIVDSLRARCRFLTVSPDESSVAWLLVSLDPPSDDQSPGVLRYQLVVTDGRAPDLPPISLDRAFMDRNPEPSSPMTVVSDLASPTPFQAWFNGLFRWERGVDERWHVVRR